MELIRWTDRVWYYPFESERDRPNLGYIRGHKWSLAVDAGHSEAHVKEFYAALEKAGLPLPTLTVLTHWHWDHTFGIHAIHGLALGNAKTDGHLKAFRKEMEARGRTFFLDIDESIRREYPGDTPVIVRDMDLVYHGEMLLDLGNCPVRLFQTEAPHTDDSTLVYVPGDGALFIGDAACDEFRTGGKDMEKCRRLAAAIRETGAEYCLEGHWTPLDTDETLADLLA